MMTKAPERIWVTPFDEGSGGGTYCDASGMPIAPNHDAFCYRRADLLPKVKPLEWRERESHLHAADSVIGMHYITECAGMSQPFKLNTQRGSEHFATLEAAKAAAQADYERRILSAIDGNRRGANRECGSTC